MDDSWALGKAFVSNATAVSPDHKTLLILTSGFNLVFSADATPDKPDCAQWMLRLDPIDTLDARLLLKEVRANSPWHFPLGRAGRFLAALATWGETAWGLPAPSLPPLAGTLSDATSPTWE